MGLIHGAACWGWWYSRSSGWVCCETSQREATCEALSADLIGQE